MLTTNVCLYWDRQGKGFRLPLRGSLRRSVALNETNFSAGIEVLTSLISSFNEADAFEMLIIPNSIANPP